MENLIPYEGYFRVKTPLMFSMRGTHRGAIYFLALFGEREAARVIESEILRARNGLMDFPLIVWTLVGIVGAADHQQRRTYRKFTPPFFSGELYRRTRELSISFLFDENPVVTSVGSVDAPVGGMRSIPYARVGLRWQAFSAAQVVWNKSNRYAGTRGGARWAGRDG